MSAGGPFAEAHPLLRRVEALQKGELSTNEIILLCQDIIERNEIMVWGQRIYELIVHCVNQNLCTLVVFSRVKQ